MVVAADAVGVAVIVSMIVVRAVILVIVAVVMVVMVVPGVAAVAAVVVMLAHASFPFDGSAICSSISLRTSLIWASAAE